MYNTAPKYKKIEILLNKSGESKYNTPIQGEKKDKPNSIGINKVTDTSFSTREKCVFEDVALVVTGGYILITQENGGDDLGSERSTIGRIFDLKDVYSYKAYFEER